MLKLWDFLDFGVTNSFITPQMVEQLGVKTELVTNPNMVQLAQGIVRPLLIVMLRIKLICGRIQIFENFTMCDLDNFDVILRNTFLDAYEIDIPHNECRLKSMPNVALS